MSVAVSIIMATYNRGNYIAEALLSIQNQSFENWECLTIDDGGTDNTSEIIEPILNRDNRFRYFTRPEKYKKGLPGCRNFGLDLAKGSYIIFFDDDDIVHPLNLEICLSTLEANSELFFCQYNKKPFYNDDFIEDFDLGLHFDSKTTLIDHYEKMIMDKHPMASCTVLWRKECFENLKFKEELLYAEEWELYSRILCDGFNGVLIDKVLYFNRKHSESNTAKFYGNDSIHVNSKKLAVRLITENLVNKNLLTPELLKYLAGYAVKFRDYILLNELLQITDGSMNTKMMLKIKFYLYPYWSIYTKFKVRKTTT